MNKQDTDFNGSLEFDDMDRETLRKLEEELREAGFSPEDWEDDDPFSVYDDLPMEGTPLCRVLRENGILKTGDRARYREYDPSNPGCSPENPIVIRETEDYVHLEYRILRYIVCPEPFRIAEYEILSQALVCEGERHMDILTLRVHSYPAPFTSEDYDDVLDGVYTQKRECSAVTEEKYWFDITAGFQALSSGLEER